MNFPLIPKAEALQLLEDAEFGAQQRSEIEAELGSAYFMAGFSEAAFIARSEMDRQEADFLASEEGQRYSERMAAARLYDALPSPLTSWDIPEFVDGKPSYAHSPFARYQESSDDIPF